jgi:hypothetical protein
MKTRTSIFWMVLIGAIGLLMCVSLAAAQSEVVSPGNEKEEDVITRDASSVPAIDPELDAQFEARIVQIQQDTEAQISQLEASLETANDDDVQAILMQIGSIKKEAQISILEQRQAQYQARGDIEMAAKFQRAAEMIRNPAPRQAPSPEMDRARLEQNRSTQEQTKR